MPASRRGSSCLGSGSTFLHTYSNTGPLDICSSNGSKVKDSGHYVNTGITYANIAGEDVPDIGFITDENIYYNLPPPAPHGGNWTASSSRGAGVVQAGAAQASPPSYPRNKVLQGANSCPSSPKLPKSPHRRRPHHGMAENKVKTKTPPLHPKSKKLVHTRSFDLDHLYQNLVRVATRPRSNSFSVPWRRRKKSSQEATQIAPLDIQEEAKEDNGDTLTQHKYQEIPLLTEDAPKPPSSGIVLSRPLDNTKSCSRSRSSRSSSSCSDNSSNGSDFEPCPEVCPGITYLREASPDQATSTEQHQDWEWYHSAATLPLRRNKAAQEIEDAVASSKQHQQQQHQYPFTADINTNLEEWRKKERWLGKKRSAKNLRHQGTGGGEVDVALFFASDGVSWTSYLQNVFTSLLPEDDGVHGQPSQNLRCELLNVEELTEELAPLKAEKLKTAKLQVILVSPLFLNHVHAYPDTSLGTVFMPDRVLGLLLGVQDEDVTPLHIAALYSYSDWRRLDVRNMDLSFVVEVLTQGTYILSNCDVYQGYQKSGTARFKVTPRKVNENQRRLFVILNESVGSIEDVTVLIRQEGKATKAIENVRLRNPYTLVFNMPDEYLHISSLLFISVLVGQTDLGCRQLKCESRMDTLKDILHTAGNTTHFMCQAMNINPISDELDRKLADMVKNHTPLEKLDMTHDYYGHGGAVFPTWLHFASHYGLEHLAWALLELPGGEAALTIPNAQGHTPPLLAYRENFTHFARELEDAALISSLAVSVYPCLSGVTESSSDTIRGTSASYATPPPPRPLTSSTPPPQHSLTSTTPPPHQLLSPGLLEYDQPSPPRPVSRNFVLSSDSRNSGNNSHEGSPSTPVVSASLLNELRSHSPFSRTPTSDIPISRYVDMSGQEGPSTPTAEYPDSVYTLLDAWNRKMNIKTFMEDNQEIISQVKTSIDGHQNRKLSNASHTDGESISSTTCTDHGTPGEDAIANSLIMKVDNTYPISAATTTTITTPQPLPEPSTSTPQPSTSTTPSSTPTPLLSSTIADDRTAAVTPSSNSSTPRHHNFSSRNIGTNFFRLLRGMRSPPVHLDYGAGRSLHDQPNDYIPDPTLRTRNGCHDDLSSESSDDESNGESLRPEVEVLRGNSQSPHITPQPHTRSLPSPPDTSTPRLLPTPPGTLTRQHLHTPPDRTNTSDFNAPAELVNECSDSQKERPPHPPPRPPPKAPINNDEVYLTAAELNIPSPIDITISKEKERINYENVVLKKKPSS